MDREMEAAFAPATMETRQQGVLTIDRLIAIWTRVLQTSPIFPDSNFFDLGGDSLLAVGLFLEIEAVTGRSLPITTIYDAPTIAELVGLLDMQEKPKFSPLVRLKEGKGISPLFVVHGIGGTVMELSGLGKLIQTDNPVYAIQARGLDGAEPPLESVEDMAAYYVEAVRQHQPHGPYLLCGYSFGGLVALEMCRQLKQEQGEIGLLLMIDAYAHPRTWPLLPRLVVGWRRAQHRRAELAEQPLRETAAYVWQRANRLLRIRNSTQSTPGNAASRWLRDRKVNLPPALRKVREAGERALSAYVPRYYAGKVTFLRAEITDPVFPPNPTNIWRSLAQEFELHTVPGDHLSIIGEHADRIATRLSRCLAEIQDNRSVDGKYRRRAAAATRPEWMESVPC
jgi:acetoacetyl-CoA synthetase